VVFRRILPLIALVVWASACTSQGSPPPTATSAAAADQGAAQGSAPAVPREIEREVGAVYPDAALQAYVDRVGQKLVAQPGFGGNYRFVVLDMPSANAHALSNYIFVTRGLLAGLDDEAELAAALSHELGHLVQRHAAQRARARQGVLNAAVEATTVTGSVTVGRSVARDGLLALRRYSREQELEADRIGLSFLVRAGYRGDAMASLIEKLRRQSQFELQLMGEAPDSVDRRTATSTHPAPIERLAALQGIPQAAAAGETGRAVYLEAINGMSVDDAPQEGFVRDNKFLHPLLKLGFTAPRDFRLFNDQDGVLGVGRDRSLLFFSCINEPVPGSLAEWMRDKLKPTPADIQPAQIDGVEAAIGAKPRGLAPIAASTPSISADWMSVGVGLSLLRIHSARLPGMGSLVQEKNNSEWSRPTPSTPSWSLNRRKSRGAVKPNLSNGCRNLLSRTKPSSGASSTDMPLIAAR